MKLKLQHFFDKVRLKSDKTVDVVNSIQISWIKNEFRITIDYMMLNMKNDFILNENLWQNYRLCFNYDVFEIKVMNNEIKYSLFDMYVNFSRFQILNNESLRVDCISRRVFEKFIRKSVECFFYFIRNVEKFIKMSKEFAFMQWIIKHLKLNKTLSFNLLKVFKNNLSNQSFSIKLQNHNINTSDVKLVNKTSYYFFKKKTKKTNDLNRLSFEKKNLYDLIFIFEMLLFFLLKRKITFEK